MSQKVEFGAERGDWCHGKGFKERILYFQMIEEVEKLTICLEEMEQRGKVDFNGSRPIIDNLAKSLILFRENLLKSNMPNEEVFKTYYPSFVVSVVLQNIVTRLKEAEKAHDNPIIAMNSLKVIPAMRSIILGFQEKSNFDFMNLATSLQLNAKANGLFNIDYNRLKTADDVLKDIISEHPNA
jgi:hypothetical protein